MVRASENLGGRRMNVDEPEGERGKKMLCLISLIVLFWQLSIF